jgi:hypothetical protein
MEITLKITKENKDGSADAIVRFDKEGMQTLIQWGLVAMLKQAVDEYATSEQIASRANPSVAKGRKPAIKKTPAIKKKVKAK